MEGEDGMERREEVGVLECTSKRGEGKSNVSRELAFFMGERMREKVGILMG